YYTTLFQSSRSQTPIDIQYNPSPDELESQLMKTNPVLIHIAGAVRESSGGVYLDFESSQSRSLDYVSPEGQHEIGKPSNLVYNPDRLARILSRLPSAPFVILDIVRPQNPTETLRMLMLRNQFAAQLFRVSNVPGVLAAGLAQPHEVRPLTERLVTAAVLEQR